MGLDATDYYCHSADNLLSGALVPTIALTVRRIRDTGRDWPWIFVGFVPYIGGLLVLLLCAQKTDMSQHRPEWEDNSPGKPVDTSHSGPQPTSVLS